MNHFEQTAFSAGVNYKFLMYIETMDGGNDTILDSWVLEGCFLTNVKFAALDYASNEFQKIEMSIRYDNATMTSGLETATPEFIPGVMVD